MPFYKRLIRFRLGVEVKNGGSKYGAPLSTSLLESINDFLKK